MPARALHWFCVLTAFVTLVLIALGGLVTSHGVGMAVPDWPNTYGYNMFFFPVSQWVGGVFYEHTHRLLASAVGLMTAIMALWLHGRAARPLMCWLGGALLVAGLGVVLLWPARGGDAFVVGGSGVALLVASLFWRGINPAAGWLRRLGLAAFIAVVAQGVLGGLRVTAMKDELGIFHAVLAQMFFALVCALALFTSNWFQTLPAVDDSQPLCKAKRQTQRLFIGATFLILAQLALGASMRHQHAGLAVPDFPMAYGEIWPDTSPAAVERYNQQRLEVVSANPITAWQVHLHMAHRILAVVIALAVAACAVRAWKVEESPALIRLNCLWAGLILVQVGLGAWTVLSNKAADIATIHVVVGALSLATGTIVSIVSHRLWSGFGLLRVASKSLPLRGSSILPPKPALDYSG